MIKNNLTIKLILALLTPLTTLSQTADWTMKANPAFNSINGVAFRLDGQKVMSGTNCHPASIRIYNTTDGVITWDYEVGSDFMCIMGVAFSTNGNYISAIEEFGNIFIFDNSSVTPTILDTINTGTSYGFATTISPLSNQVAVGCSNGKLQTYSLPGSTLDFEVNAHPGWVLAVAYSPNGEFIVTGGDDNKVKIWNMDGTLHHTCTGHSSDITNVKVTPDNAFVVSSSRDDKIKIWDIATGELIQTIEAHTDDVNGIDISPDGSKIVSASSDSTCKIWSFSSGELLSTFGIPDSGAVNAVAWSPSGDKIVTGNILSDVVMWSLPESLTTAANIQLNDFQYVVYPNPAGETLRLNLPLEINIRKMEIRDNLGRMVLSKHTDFANTAISHLTPGQYSIWLYTTENKKSIQTFIKK